MVWNLAGVFLPRSLDRYLGIWCSDFWLRPPFLKYWGLHFAGFEKENVNLNISGTGVLIKNRYIRFLDLCLRNTPAKFQTTVPSQFFRKWRRNWKNSPEIRRFKAQASYTIVCKRQPLRHDMSRRGSQINLPFFASCLFFPALLHIEKPE